MIDETQVDNTLVETPQVVTKSVRKNPSPILVESMYESEEASKYESTDSESITTQPTSVPIPTKKSQAFVTTLPMIYVAMSPSITSTILIATIEK